MEREKHVESTGREASRMKVNWHRVFGIVVMVLVSLRLVGAWNNPEEATSRVLFFAGVLVVVVAVEVYAYANDLW